LSSPPEAPGVDFFHHSALPVPLVTIDEAERMATSLGPTVRAQPLGIEGADFFADALDRVLTEGW
jgi:hypothetical protein